jgi:hypothetical protein
VQVSQLSPYRRAAILAKLNMPRFHRLRAVLDAGMAARAGVVALMCLDNDKFADKFPELLALPPEDEL